MSALEEYNAYVGAADGYVTGQLADAMRDEFLARIEELSNCENCPLCAIQAKRADEAEAALDGLKDELSDRYTALLKAEATIERLKCCGNCGHAGGAEIKCWLIGPQCQWTERGDG